MFLFFKGHEKLLHGMGRQRGDHSDAHSDAKQDGQLHAWAKEVHPRQAEYLFHADADGAAVGVKALDSGEGLDRG